MLCLLPLLLLLLNLPFSTPLPVRMPSKSGPCASGTTHTLELAIAYDSTFCALHFNRENIASAYVQATVNDASRYYTRDTCVSLALVHIDGHCNRATDPYRSLANTPVAAPAGSSQKDLVTSLRDIWNQSPARASVRRDVVVFFSGFNDGTDFIGSTNLNSVCQDDGFAWVEHGVVDTFVHEVGHTLSATHTISGIMSTTVRPGSPIFFSQDSINQITTYIDTYGDAGKKSRQEDARCLDTTPPTCDASCPGPCVSGACIARYKSSAPAGVVPCSPLKLRFRCVDEKEGRKFGVDCASNLQFVRRSGPGDDVFCCAAPSREVSADIITTGIVFGRFSFGDGTETTELIPRSAEGRIMQGSTLMSSNLILDCGGGGGGSGGTTAPATTTRTVATTTRKGKGKGKKKR